MPEIRKNVELLRVFISSPGDVAEERDLVKCVLQRINQTDGEELGLRFEAIDWTTDIVPKLGAGPQEIVDEQTPDYDIYIGILAMRFGTATGEFGSGTEKEFNDAITRYRAEGRPWILFYFKNLSAAPATVKELQQYRKVLKFQEKVETLGILGKYTALRGADQSFFERLEHDLRLLAHKLTSSKEASGPAEGDRQFFTDQEPTEAELRAALVAKAQIQLFDVISPCYLLDANFYFLDWNTTFEEFVAKPLGLTRKDHAIEFVRKLANCDEVMEHSKETFGYGKENPIVDTEVLKVQTEKYGMIHFGKIAAQLTDDDGSLLAWVVNLDLVLADKNLELRRDIESVLKEKLNWTRYALSYDKLLLPFDDYQRLIDLVVREVGDARLCLDLGAGTGNGALRLLQTDRQREVWAVDFNEAMLRYLWTKAKRASTSSNDYRKRLVVIKDDIHTLRMLRDKEVCFDAAVLINVLYAVQDPMACLKQVHKLLKPGGLLVLSTPHRDTDVDRLFTEMKLVLERKRKFAELKSNYDDARAVHVRMNEGIHRDTKRDVRRYLDQSGFDIVNWHDHEYVDSVVVIKAVKRA